MGSHSQHCQLQNGLDTGTVSGQLWNGLDLYDTDTQIHTYTHARTRTHTHTRHTHTYIQTQTQTHIKHINTYTNKYPTHALKYALIFSYFYRNNEYLSVAMQHNDTHCLVKNRQQDNVISNVTDKDQISICEYYL